MVVLVYGVNMIAEKSLNFCIWAFDSSHSTFHNKIPLHIPVTTINLSCLYILLLLASVSE